MATFYYVKGAAVPNAQKYELYKKSGSSYAKVDTQEILQQLNIVGTIATNGAPAEKQAVATKGGAAISVTPITKLDGDGYAYYIRVSGLFDLETDAARLTDIPFQGTHYFTNIASPANVQAVSFNVTGIQYSSASKAIQLLTNLGEIDVYSVDLGNTIIRDLQIVSGNASGDGNEVTVYSAHTEYRRTDFIPIEELTDNLKAAEAANAFYCVGKFSNSPLEIPVYKMSFYRGMSYSSFLKGYKYGVGDNDIGAQYLSVEQVKDYAPEGANYVIFSSAVSETAYQKNADFVSVGGINFMLTGNDAVSAGDSLAVKAIGDGQFFADSEYSNTVTYNPQS